MSPTHTPRRDPDAPARRASVWLALTCLFVAALATAGEPVETKFWGRSSLLIAYDTMDLRSGIDFGNYVTADGQDRVNFNPRDTRIGMSAAQKSGDWTYKSVFEMDFYGDNAGNNLLPRLRLGYVEAASAAGFSLRAGQDWIPIAQQNAGTVDFGILAWGGNLWWRVPQVTVRKKSGDVELLAGAMKHRISGTQEAAETMPWLVGRLAWAGIREGKGMLAIGGGVRSNTLEDGPDSTRGDYDAWLVCAEWKLPLGDKVVLNGEAWTGTGIGREFVRYDLDYNRQAVESIMSQGGFANVAFDLGGGWQANAGLGIDDPDDDDLLGAATVIFTKNTVWYGNVKWQVTDRFGTGFEFMNFTTEKGEDTELEGQRVTLGTWFSF